MDPNGVGVNNGNLFGIDCSEQDADLVIIPIPWDVTSSYGRGSSMGPQAMLEASIQLDFFHPKVEKAWGKKLYMRPITQKWLDINNGYADGVQKYIAHLENGGVLEGSEFESTVNEINIIHEQLKDDVYTQSLALLKQNKKVAILGGEHSTPLGLLQALGDVYADFAILQIDAHADLRDGYEGFQQSHASIMHHALQIESISKIVQVGVRDLSPNERQFIEDNDRVETIFDWDLAEEQFAGLRWKHQVKRIVERLPGMVYISFDIDGLEPSNCPNTGTPVPGGLSYNQAIYLIQEVKAVGKTIVGFDLCEVAPGLPINAITGARVLWELCL